MKCRSQLVGGPVYRRSVLLDTSALFAVVDPGDGRHLAASDHLQRLRDEGAQLNVTVFTIAETHRLILQRKGLGRQRACRFLKDIYDGGVNVIRAGPADESCAVQLVEQYDDQDLTMHDAIGMAVCLRLGLFRVFTFDWHFRLSGLAIEPL